MMVFRHMEELRVWELLLLFISSFFSSRVTSSSSMSSWLSPSTTCQLMRTRLKESLKPRLMLLLLREKLEKLEKRRKSWELMVFQFCRQVRFMARMNMRQEMSTMRTFQEKKLKRNNQLLMKEVMKTMAETVEHLLFPKAHPFSSSARTIGFELNAGRFKLILS